MATRTQRIISAAAGGGGLDWGVQRALESARTVCYIENEVTACAVLVHGMEAGRLDEAPVWTDAHTFDGRPWRGAVDGIIGGYPCQPFSVAGSQRGADDPRHLWPTLARIVREVDPAWCFFENVGNHLRIGGREVLGELQCMGYQTAAGLFTASEVGAPHKRERFFILAYSAGLLAGEAREQPAGVHASRRSGEGDVGDAHRARSQGRGRSEPGGAYERPAWPPSPASDEWTSVPSRLWPATESTVRGVADGLARGDGLPRADQLRILGNGVVPEQAAFALHTLAHDLGVAALLGTVGNTRVSSWDKRERS